MDDVQALIDKRSDLEQRRSRLLGKMEAATQALSEIDERLQSMGINPDNLEQEIARLKAEREATLNQLTLALQEAEQVISKVEARLATL
jgi:uncharacterized coiled-coil DUF342 family protein